MPIHHSVFNHPFETKHQEIDWIDGSPFSPIYDDRFFQADAIKEIKDVFIVPNNLEDRFKKSRKLSIGELGFGFGLNFFVTAMIWSQSKRHSSSAVLNYLSIEEALPSKEEISKVLENFPELQKIGEYFLSHYLPVHNDMQRIELPGLNIRLTLIQNNAELALQNLLGFSNNLIDAWYLDGLIQRRI